MKPTKNTVHKLIQHHFDAYQVKRFSKGSVIIAANEDPMGVSLLVDGIVEQYDITPEGNKVVVNMFRPPSFFPMSWAINKTPNKYFYEAFSDASLKTADADKTIRFLQDHPDVLFDLLSRVYKGTDALLRRLVIASCGMASNRLIFELLMEGNRFGIESSPNERTVTIKQSTLAARSGLARETVNRELHKLEQDGLIARVNQDIIITPSLLEQRLDMNV